MYPTRSAGRRSLAVAIALCAGLLGPAACDDPGRPETVAAVEIAAPATRVAVGQSIQLSASVRNGAGAVLTGQPVGWTSSDPAVATVADGQVTGRAPGTATITATAGGKEDRVEVTVEAAPPAPVAARVTVEPDSFLLVVGSAVAIRTPTEDHAANNAARVLAVPRDAAGAVLLWLPVSYATSDAGVATVSDSGVVRAVAPGTATITARTGAAEGRLTVTVERPYTVTYLGTLAGLPESRATGINSLGQVVGYSSAPTASPAAEPVLSRGWTWQDGRLTELGVPDTLGTGALTVAPMAINGRGQVGGVVRAPRGTFVSLWENGRATLVPPPGPNLLFGGMNELGEMVGGWVADRCTRNCGGGGWIVRAGTLTGLDNRGALRLMPRAINDAGQIAGTLYRAGSGTESGRAFLLQSAAAAEVVFPPTSEILSEGNAIDAGGRVFGHDLVGGEIRPFTWRPGGAVTHLGMLRRGLIASATAANDRGDAVGRNTCISCPSALPVLFRNGGRAVRVEDLVAGGDWVWETVTDINDRGQVVGFGTHRTTGVRGALLLTPPAP